MAVRVVTSVRGGARALEQVWVLSEQCETGLGAACGVRHGSNGSRVYLQARGMSGPARAFFLFSTSLRKELKRRLLPIESLCFGRNLPPKAARAWTEAKSSIELPASTGRGKPALDLFSASGHAAAARQDRPRLSAARCARHCQWSAARASQPSDHAGLVLASCGQGGASAGGPRSHEDQAQVGHGVGRLGACVRHDHLCVLLVRNSNARRPLRASQSPPPPAGLDRSPRVLDPRAVTISASIRA